MARMRSLKPEFWLDRKLARSLSRDERMLYLGLWNQADEWGRANGDARVIKGQVFPYDDDIDLGVLDTLIKALTVARVVQMYEVDGDPFLFLPKLAKHQRLEPHKVPSRHPAPPPLDADQPIQVSPESHPDESAPDLSAAQTSPRGIRAKHVAGSMEQGAGSRGADQSAPAPDDEPTPLADLPEPPLCRRHEGWDRDAVPGCAACGRLRVQWEAARAHAAGPPPKPPWCGHCDEHTRQREAPDGVYRCPECHPLAIGVPA